MPRFLSQILFFIVLVVVLAAWIALPPIGDAVLIALFVAWLAVSPGGRQSATLALVGLRSIASRLGVSSVIVIGIACVTAVVASLLAMGAGFDETMRSGGSDTTVIVLRGGSASESQSVLLRSDVDAVKQLPGIATGKSGDPLVSAELVVATAPPDEPGRASLQLRGVDPTGWELRPALRITEGRAFTPGTRELVVGDGLLRTYPKLRPGSSFSLGGHPWKVVGAFHGGDAYDSELWADRIVVADDYRRGDTAESVLLRLVSPNRLDALNASIDANPALHVETDTTKGFFARQAGNLTTIVRIVGTAVGGIMALGAAFGALNCMFAAVATRQKEIATLRAIGFRGGSMIVAVMIECMVLALLGGVLGALVAWVCFNGHTASTMNGFNQVVYRFQVAPEVLLSALKWALAIGFVGGLYPGLRSARLSVTQALRDA